MLTKIVKHKSAARKRIYEKLKTKKKKEFINQNFYQAKQKEDIFQ